MELPREASHYFVIPSCFRFNPPSLMPAGPIGEE